MRFQFRQYDSEAVVFDAASGDTHYLKPLTLALYQTCCEAPHLSSIEIGDRLAKRLAISANPTFYDLVEESLGSLQRIGLLHTP